MFKVRHQIFPSNCLLYDVRVVLASMVAHSLVEDELGQVQRDIPRVLEAFSKFLTALEEYHVELNALQPPMAPDDEVSIRCALLYS